MFVRLCTLALVGAPLIQNVQYAETKPEPQGLWSSAVRDRALAFEGDAQESRELGNRVIAQVPMGAQGALRLMRLRQSDLKPKPRDQFKDIGADADYEAKARDLTERRYAEAKRWKQKEFLKAMDARDADESESLRDAEVARDAAKQKLAAAQAELDRRRGSTVCALGSFACGVLTISERGRRDLAERDANAVDAELEARAQRLTDLRKVRDDLRREVERHPTNLSAEARALEGFYRTSGAPGCPRRLAFHQGPGVGLRENPFLSGPVSEEDVSFDRAKVFACVDGKRRLEGVEVTDGANQRLALSEITRDSSGQINRVRIYDGNAKLVEEHHWSNRSPEYEVTFRGLRGGRVRAYTR